jgi:hypothetical protein
MAQQGLLAAGQQRGGLIGERQGYRRADGIDTRVHTPERPDAARPPIALLLTPAASICSLVIRPRWAAAIFAIRWSRDPETVMGARTPSIFTG